MKILGVDFGYGSGENKDVISLVGIEKTNEKCEVISCETRYINWDVIEMTDYIDDKFNGYNYITINSTGIGMSLIDNLKQNLKYKNKIIEYSVRNIERTHNLITRLHDSKLNECLGLDIPIKMICGRLKFDFENKSIIESTTLLALSLANDAFYNIPKPLEFNEENIRGIADESFLESLWNMESFSCDCRDIFKGRERLKREDFIKTVVDGCLNSKVIHLSFDEWHRGISKSHFISKMSSEFKIPVVYKFDSHIKIHEKDCYKVYKFNKLIGIKPCKILIDEGFTFEEVRKLRNQGFEVLGFINTCGRYNLI